MISFPHLRADQKLFFSVFQLIINIRWAFFLEVFDSFTYCFLCFIRICLDFTYFQSILFFRFSFFNIFSIVFTRWLLIINWKACTSDFSFFSGSYPFFLVSISWGLTVVFCSLFLAFHQFSLVGRFSYNFWFQSYAIISFLTFDFRISSYFLRQFWFALWSLRWSVWFSFKFKTFSPVSSVTSPLSVGLILSKCILSLEG